MRFFLHSKKGIVNLLGSLKAKPSKTILLPNLLPTKSNRKPWPLVVVKKRKNNEEWAIKKKLQLQERAKRRRPDSSFMMKPEQFIREYRDKMKSRVIRKRWASAMAQSKLLFVIRIGGQLKFHILFCCRILRFDDLVSYPNFKSVKDLIYKKGVIKDGKERVPLTDNNIVEQKLVQHDIICIEDIVKELVTNFLCPFMLNNPEKALHSKKKRFEDGGDSGDRVDHINELLSKMN
ncbi:60S ribosomal protein L7 [Striga asiatica]|uniref:60S ribosomal protein L7 n=1 Tax=Striga asiatica TaxID=4170 RepID=A0A5A7QUA7_STRAF|nr:60S ribosomal protein L7 [Striga asiatica]